MVSGSLKVGKGPTKCELTEITTDEVYLQSIDTEEWAISTPEMVHIQPTCVNLEDALTLTKPRIPAKGDLQIHVPRQCSVAIGHHTIPTRLLMTKDMGKITNRLVIPTLHTHQLLDMHGTQLVDEKMDKELDTVFKDMVEQYHRKAFTLNTTSHEVKELVKTMLKETHEAEQIQPEYHYHAITWSTVLMIAGVVAGIVWWIRRRPPTTNTEIRWVETSNPQAPLTQPAAPKRKGRQPDTATTTV
jgi:hypothetical protein